MERRLDHLYDDDDDDFNAPTAGGFGDDNEFPAFSLDDSNVDNMDYDMGFSSFEANHGQYQQQQQQQPPQHDQPLNPTLYEEPEDDFFGVNAEDDNSLENWSLSPSDDVELKDVQFNDADFINAGFWDDIVDPTLFATPLKPSATSLIPLNELIGVVMKHDKAAAALIVSIMNRSESSISRKKEAGAQYETERIVTLDDVAYLTRTSHVIKLAMEKNAVWRAILRAVVFGPSITTPEVLAQNPQFAQALTSWEHALLFEWIIQLTSATETLYTSSEIEVWRLLKRYVEHVIMIRKQLIWKREWNLPATNVKGLQFGQVPENQGPVAEALFPLLYRGGNPLFMTAVQGYFDGLSNRNDAGDRLDAPTRGVAKSVAMSLHAWTRATAIGNVLVENGANWCQFVSSNDDTDALFYVITSTLFEKTTQLGRVLTYDRKWNFQTASSILPIEQPLALPYQNYAVPMVPIYPLYGDRYAVVNNDKGQMMIGVYGVTDMYRDMRRGVNAQHTRSVGLELFVWDRRSHKVDTRRLADNYGTLLASSTNMIVPAAQQLLSIHASRYAIIVNFTNFVAIIDWDAEGGDHAITPIADCAIHIKVWSSVVSAVLKTPAGKKLLKKLGLDTPSTSSPSSSPKKQQPLKPAKTRPTQKEPRGSTTKWVNMSDPLNHTVHETRNVSGKITEWIDLSPPIPTSNRSSKPHMGDIWGDKLAATKNMLRCATIALDPVHGRRFLAMIMLANGINANCLSYPVSSVLVWCEYVDTVVDATQRWRVYAHDNTYKLAVFATPFERDHLKKRSASRKAQGMEGAPKFVDMIERRSTDWMRMSASARFTLDSIFSVCASHLTIALVTPIYFDERNKPIEKSPNSAEVLTLVTHRWQELRALMVAPRDRITNMGTITTRIVVKQIERFWVSNIAGMPWVIVKQPRSIGSHNAFFIAEPGAHVAMEYKSIGMQLVSLQERLNIHPQLFITHILGFAANGMLLVAVRQVDAMHLLYVVPFTPDHELFPSGHPDKRLLSSSTFRHTHQSSVYGVASASKLLKAEPF